MSISASILERLCLAKCTSHKIGVVIVSACTFGSATAMAQPESAPAPPPAPAPPERAPDDGANADTATKQVPQPTSEDTAQAVTPPRLLNFVDAPYPPEARKERRGAEVVLRLDIDAVGRVTEASVHQSGGEHFDKAARQAALQFVFTPALRAGRPIAARILYTYRFEPPAETTTNDSSRAAPEPSTAAPDAALDATQPAQPPQDTKAASAAERGDGTGSTPASDTATDAPLAVVDIIVEGERQQESNVVHRVEKNELQRVPGTMGDALRAIQSLPGIAQTPSVSGLLIVRGTPSESTQIFFDGVLTPQIYHFGGLSSVVPTEMLDSIDFRPGNYDAEYGRGIGGVVDAKFRSPKSDGLHAMAQLDLIDARAMVEGPVPGADGWTLMGGARRSHVDAWLGPLLEGSNTSFTQLPVYYDYQLFAQRESRNGDLIRIGVYGADDTFTLLSETSVFLSHFTQRHAFWNLVSEYRTQLTNATSWQHVASVGHLLERIRIGPLASNTKAYPAVFRGTLSHRLSDSLTLRVGPDFVAAPFRVRFTVSEENITGDPLGTSPILQPPRLASSQSAFFQPGVFAALDARLGARWKVTPGVRLDYTRGTDRWDVSPRLNASYAVARDFPRTTLTAGAGLYYEPPEVRFTLPEYGSADLESHRSSQLSLGLTQEFTRHFEGRIEGFYSRLDHLLSRAADANGVGQLNNAGEGRTYGGELLLRYTEDEHFFGWLSYTLSRSERRLVPGSPYELYDFDQTHVGSILGTFKLGAGWQFGGRFRLVSGAPFDPCEQEVYSASEGETHCLVSGRSQQRAPWFHQLDLRLEKRWQPSQALAIDTYVDVINVYNRTQADLPFVPSLGLRVEL